MPTCPHCGKRLLRVRRTLFEKLLHSDMYACSGCRKRVGALRPSLIFLLSKHARCILCGSSEVARLAKADKVDSFTTDVLGLAQRLVGAPVCRCSPCRVQFYDWRRVRSSSSSDEK
jgi:hypothetical protein